MEKPVLFNGCNIGMLCQLLKLSKGNLSGKTVNMFKPLSDTNPFHARVIDDPVLHGLHIPLKTPPDRRFPKIPKRSACSGTFIPFLAFRILGL